MRVAIVLSCVLACATAHGEDGDEQRGMPRVLEPSKISEADFARAKAMFSHLGGEMGPSKKGTRATKLHGAPAPRELTKPQLAQIIARLRRSFFFGFRMNDEVKIEGDVGFVPNLESGALDVQWSSVTGPDGKNLLRRPTAEEAERDRAFPRNGLTTAEDGSAKYEKELRLTVKDRDAVLVKAEGTARLKVPSSFTKLVLPCTVGAKAEADGQSATVRRCENDYVEIDWMSKGQDPIIVINDGGGRRLETSSTETMPLAAGGRTIAQLEYKDLPVNIEGARMAFNVEGKVGGVELYTPKTWAREELPVFASGEPTVEGDKPIKIAAPRTFVERADRGFGIVKSSAADVKTKTKIVAARTYAVMDYNQPKVEVRLPKADNSLYATVEFGEAKVFDAKKKILPHKPSSIWVTFPDLQNELRFENPSGEGILAIGRAKGTVKVRYPTLMHIITLTKAAPDQDGISAKFEGARVTLVGEPGDELRPKPPSFAPPEFDIVRAYDSNGERIRQLGGESWSGEGHVLAFWGEPVEIRLRVVDKWEEVALSYDLPAAPLLPKDRAGQKP